MLICFSLLLQFSILNGLIHFLIFFDWVLVYQTFIFLLQYFFVKDERVGKSEGIVLLENSLERTRVISILEVPYGWRRVILWWTWHFINKKYLIIKEKSALTDKNKFLNFKRKIFWEKEILFINSEE